MEAARQMGAGALLISGNIAFYGKAGFVVASTCGIHYFAEPREAEVPLLLSASWSGYLAGVTGTYKDPEGYFVDEADADAFDTQFPPKEKLNLPGQLG